MNRRTSNKLAGLVAVGAMAEHCELGAEHTHTVAEEAVLQDDAIPVVFDPASGVLMRMEQ